ncbi:hypothetical protein [Pseudoxanthomonas suwonensis]|jgi:hypothetical protein|uniref:hypothetical protein n=1 Tax=Pseudoxanthomonas suwonensis TaxID=314722 RepID=UPI0004642724|nr:hypothetical protein [Pseudoxanthomonas suwonensis]
MRLARLLSRLFGAASPSADNDFRLPTLGESRPHGHFREFTAPRRLQRGGVAVGRKASKCADKPNGIIPCVGGNIP